MNETKYFTLAELLQSNTALTKQIPNLPTWQQVENLNRLVTTILDPVRETFGKPIKITSGFRSPTLNNVVGGVGNSQHKQGLAADLQANDLSALKSAILTANVPFDQLIEEHKGKTKWLHVSAAAEDKTPRKQVLTITIK